MEKSRLSVLIVDDYQPWRSFILSSLQKWTGVKVVGEASDGQEAVQKSRQLQPDLIVLDIGLPKINGIEASRQIRRQLPSVTILFCSDSSSPDIAEEALRTGAGYLVKSDAGSELVSAVAAVTAGKCYVSRALAGHAFAEVLEFDPVRGRKHVVQFYRDDAVLLDGLTRLFRGSLGEGCSVGAVMTTSHRSGLERRLLEQGVDASDVTRNGRLCMLDADEALSEFMESSRRPSREGFLSKFGEMLRKLEATTAAKENGVVVFGEMVAVLWAQKKYEAAIRLEELWNELAQTCSFYLCCGYPAYAFRDGTTLFPCIEVCAQHSQVVSAF